MKVNKFLAIFLSCMFVFSACDKTTPDNEKNDNTQGDNEEIVDGDDNDNTPSETLGGYASSGGVMILNQGIRSECSTLTYVAPDGTVEENVYSMVNGTKFGHAAQDMYMYNGKFYILSDNCDKYNTLGDGSLVVADAVTLKKEKAFKYEDFKFLKPEGSLQKEDSLYMVMPMTNIVVVDEKNVFLSDQKALYRFDSTTGELYIVEGSYHFGNQGVTIESVASTRGMTVIDDYVYCGGGGFWETTRLLEFCKDKDIATRKLVDLDGDFISGICRTGEREIMLATCGRKGSTKSYLYFVDIDKWEIVKKKTIPVDISAEFFNNSGVALSGDYLYFAAGTLNISRMSVKNWKVDKNFIDVKKDVPSAEYLNCNIVADSKTQYIYVAVSETYGEDVVSKGNVLVYDCSKDTPVLIQNIENKTSYPVGIYPISNFNR
ncbi:MAG: hypothetical protein SOX26_00615 [Phocaeicola sp.]|nr:hypothetical protein [Phocaeicola sp.]